MGRRDRVPLLEGEHLAFEVRAHWYTLIWPSVMLIVTSGIGAFLAGTVPDSDARNTLRLIIAGTAVAIVLRWSVWPFLSWYARSYVLTSRRLIVREGVFARRGLDVPLPRVIGSEVSRTLLQRLFGSGRLTISTAGQHGEVVIEDAPMINDVQRVLSGLVAASAPPPAPRPPGTSPGSHQPFPPQQFRTST